MWVIISLAVSCCWTSRRNRSILHVMFLCGFIRDNGNIFSGGCWYSTMNVTIMILIFTLICILKRNVLCISILPILLTVIILWRLMKWPLLFSKVIIGESGCSCERKLCSGLILAERCGWISINIQEQFINNNIVWKMCNAWKTLDLTYYRPAYWKKNLKIGEFLFVEGFVTRLNSIFIDRWFFTRPITIIVR